MAVPEREGIANLRKKARRVKSRKKLTKIVDITLEPNGVSLLKLNDKRRKLTKITFFREYTCVRMCVRVCARAYARTCIKIRVIFVRSVIYIYKVLIYIYKSLTENANAG